MKIGDLEVILLSDGTFKLDGGQMFGVVPKTLWERKIQADERNRILMGLNCLLVRTGDELVLIETGIGDKFDAKHNNIYAVDKCGGTLLDGLKRQGVSPEDIQIVINSHLHFDHCGWNVRREGDRLIPTFPRARYVVQRGEWEHGLSPSERDRGSYVEEFFRAAEPRTHLVEGNTEILPGIRLEVIPGHNRHIQCVWIESGADKVCFISDLAPTRFHLPLAWNMSFDLYPMETLANKKRLLPLLAREQAIVIFPHDAEVPAARLAEDDGKYEAVPVKFNS